MHIVAVNNFGDTRSGGLTGPAGLFIIVLMAIATVLLVRNMNKRLRRLPDSFPDQESAKREAAIAQLDADLAQPDAEPVRPNIDRDQSKSVGKATEPEVRGTDPIEPTEPGDGAAGRS